jgi:hypothetical protein
MRNTMLLSFTIATAISFGITNAAISPTELERAIRDAKHAYQASLSQMEKMKNLSSSLYEKSIAVINKIISSEDFKSRMNASIEPQFNSITQYGTEFEGVHQSTHITDFVSTNETIQPFMAKLYDFAANKEYCNALWQKLTNYKPEEESSPDNNQTNSPESSDNNDYSSEEQSSENLLSVETTE